MRPDLEGTQATALYLAPRGRDSVVLERLLGEASIPATRCNSLGELGSRLGDDTLFVIVTEEELLAADLQAIAEWIARQPSWSDLPFVVLTKRDDGAERSPMISRLASLLGKVSFLERPFHATTLISLATTAMRGRSRQYQARERLLELQRSRDRLRESETRFRATFENAPIGIAHLDLDGTWLRVNHRLCEIFGFAEEELRAKTLQEISHPEERAANTAMLHRLIDREIENCTLEERYLQPDGKLVWINLTVGCVLDPDGAVQYLVAAVEDITGRKRQEEQIQLLMREVNHRSKNLLAVVQSIANQTARDAEPAIFAHDFTQRLIGLSASQDLLIEGDWKAVDLASLVQSQLAYLGSIKSERVAISGPRLLVTPSAAQGIGLAVHELATNALKYGALSSDAGQVTIDWRHERATPEDRFHMFWSERGGPAVVEPIRRGFGRTVIERMSAISVGGEVDLRYDPEGLSWALSAPAENVMYRSQ